MINDVYFENYIAQSLCEDKYSLPNIYRGKHGSGVYLTRPPVGIRLFYTYVHSMYTVSV